MHASLIAKVADGDIARWAVGDLVATPLVIVPQPTLVTQACGGGEIRCHGNAAA